MQSGPDDWRPGATLPILKLRARLLSTVRSFFAARGVLEVDTPYLSPTATPSPHLTSYRIDAAMPGGKAAFLHTSPEFPMKRLLAAGCSDVYQVCRVFRASELGAWHNPEFTLIEWYRRGLDYHELMDELVELIRDLGSAGISSMNCERVPYRTLFRRNLKIDPLVASIDELARCARASGIHTEERSIAEDRDDWLDLLMTHCIQPRLPRDRMVFVYEYPASQASLARLSPRDERVAERFELYLGGVELANGFGELLDADEQRARFQAELIQRRSRGMQEVPLDERFLSALGQGIPECSGVALGFDRLVMLVAGKRSLDEVMAFSVSRA